MCVIKSDAFHNSVVLYMHIGVVGSLVVRALGLKVAGSNLRADKVKICVLPLNKAVNSRFPRFSL
jgi:hypothetical protein